MSKIKGFIMIEIRKLAQLLGARIKAIRKQLKLKQSSFAEMTGISHDTLGLIERGDILPRLETVYKITSAFNIPLVKLLDFEKEIKPRHLKHSSTAPLNLYIKTELPRQIRKIQTAAQGILDKTKSVTTDKRR
ncbi:MAG: helix-turn-helix transcriptional regulator [Planctomycetota bacterium]